MPHGFRPLLPASGSLVGHLLKTVRKQSSLPSTGSGLHRLVRPTTTPSADSCYPITSPRDGASPRAEQQASQGKTRDLPPTYPPHLLPHLPDGYRASGLVAPSPRYGCLLCGSCSSGQEFACSFLPTTPRDGAVAVQLAVPAIRVRRGLPPPSHRLATTANRMALSRHAPCLAHHGKRPSPRREGPSLDTRRLWNLLSKRGRRRRFHRNPSAERPWARRPVGPSARRWRRL